MNYARPPALPDDYAADVRKAIGVAEDVCLILEPGRIVQRKGIEHAIELASRLGRKGAKARLVISHAGGAEAGEYERRLREYS